MVVTTKSGLVLGDCSLVVVGVRGAYAQFSKEGINRDALYVPPQQKWRMSVEYRNRVFYFEFRTKRDNVKIYLQRKRVIYADYLPGYLYAAVDGLFAGGRPLAATGIAEHNPECIGWRKDQPLPGLGAAAGPRTREQRLADMLGLDYYNGVPEYTGRLLRAAASVVNQMRCGGKNFFEEVHKALQKHEVPTAEFRTVCAIAGTLLKAARETSN